MKFPRIKSKAVRPQDCPAIVTTKRTLPMTSKERLERLLASDATTHLEVADAFLEAIRWIDGWWGTDLEWEPEMEVTRKVMAEMCLFMLPANDDADTEDADAEDADTDMDAKAAEERFEIRFAHAAGAYQAFCEHRSTLRIRTHKAAEVRGSASDV